MPDFLSRLFRRSGNAVKHVDHQSSVLTTRELIAHAIYGSRTILPSQAFELYRQSSALATAVDIIASKIEAIDPVVEIDGEILPRHEVVDFLFKPNDRFMWRLFIGDIARNYLLSGNAYFIGLGNVNRPPLEIYSGHPIEVNPIHSVREAFPERYSFTGKIAPGTYIREPRRGGGIRFVDGPLRELYHVIGFTTRTDKGIGDSPIESILLEIRQHVAGRVHNESMLRQGGRLSLLFLIKDWLPREQFNDLLGRLRDQFGGAENAGKVQMLSHKEMDVKEFGVSNKDMDYVNLDEVAKSAIFSRYRIPLPLITSSRQTFSNYAEAILALYDDAVLPTMSVLLEGLTDFLMPRFGRDPRRERITFDEDSIMPLRSRRFGELKEQAGLGVMTLNEIRKKLPDLDDIEGGDFVFAPASQVPIAGDGVDALGETLADDVGGEDEGEDLEPDDEEEDDEPGG